MSKAKTGLVSVPDSRDERFAGVTIAGDLAFFAGVAGCFKPGTNDIDRGSFFDGVKQSRNAYEEIVRRAEEVELTNRNLIRIENLGSGQHWRKERMSLWPDIFGTPTQAVSQGTVAKMRGQNMMTVTAVGYLDPDDIEVIVPGPDERRASRISRAGSWYFVIGVGSLELDNDGGQASAAHATFAGMAEQAEQTYTNSDGHLARAGLSQSNVFRYDGYLRDISQAMIHRDARTQHFGGRMSATSTIVGAPIGGSSDIELSAMAVADDVQRDVVYYEGRTDLARTVKAGDLVFSSGALGNRGIDGRLIHASFGDPVAQLQQALDRTLASLADFGADWSDVVRLDVYLKDPYWEATARDALVAVFPGLVPATTFTGCELEPSAEVEVTAIAYRPEGSR